MKIDHLLISITTIKTKPTAENKGIIKKLYVVLYSTKNVRCIVYKYKKQFTFI